MALKLTKTEISILLQVLGIARAQGVQTSHAFMLFLIGEHGDCLDRARVNEQKSESSKRTLRQRRMYGQIAMKQRALAKRLSNLIDKINRSRRG
jgi:hypothetical protein